MTIRSDENDQTATISDVVFLLRSLAIEIMDQAALTSSGADEALHDIANNLLDSSRKTTGARERLLLGALAQKLIETEPGAGDG
jgi:hypothetical protein